MPRPTRKCARESGRSPIISRAGASASHARAKAQFLSAVRRGIPSVSAASPSDIPAKNRSFTSSAAVGNLLRQPAEGLVEVEEIVVARGGRAGEPIEVDPASPATSLQPVAVAGVVDQHPPHRLGRGGEEVPPALEVLVADQPEVGLVNQGGGVEGVPGLLEAIRAAASLRSSS